MNVIALSGSSAPSGAGYREDQTSGRLLLTSLPAWSAAQLLLGRRPMPELSFRIGEVSALPYAAVPTISARLHITNSAANETIQSISLNCQLQLQPLSRAYSALEEARLLDLFGEHERWGQTMKPLHWTNLVVKIPPFSGETTEELSLPCSLDFDVAANKYFYGLDRGSIDVAVMFSGTVFYTGEHGSMQIFQIPWDREAHFRLQV